MAAWLSMTIKPGKKTGRGLVSVDLQETICVHCVRLHYSCLTHRVHFFIMGIQSIDGLGSSNSLLSMCPPNVRVCRRSDGANVKRVTISLWVSAGSVSRYCSTIASRF